MYSGPHYEGDSVTQYFLFGTLEDSTTVPIPPEDAGLNFWLFQKNVVEAILQDDHEKVRHFIELYQSQQNRKLVELRLENRLLIFSKEGFNLKSTQVLKTIPIKNLETKG